MEAACCKKCLRERVPFYTRAESSRIQLLQNIVGDRKLNSRVDFLYSFVHNVTTSGIKLVWRIYYFVRMNVRNFFGVRIKHMQAIVFSMCSFL